MKDYLQRLAGYNTWANRKMLEFTQAAGEERCRMEQISSFITIHATIMHVFNAQTIWLYRLNGESLSEWPGKNFSGTAVEAGMMLVNSSIEFEKWISDETDFNRIISYRNLKNEPFESSITEILSHVMNHSSYHRGQLITLFRGVGFTNITATDLIVYYREANSEK